MTQKYLKLLSLYLLLCSLPFSLFAQKRTLEDVLEVRLQNIGPVYQGTLVKGYFMLYFIDRSDDYNKSNFKLVILDEDLNKVAEKSIQEQNDAEITAVSFNGTSLMAAFYSSKWKELEIRHYDINLKLVNKVLYGLSVFSFYEGERDNIVPIEQKGFVYYYKNSMEFFPVKGIKAWKNKSKDFDITRYKYLAHSSNILLNTVTKKSGKRSRPSITYLQGFDPASGKLVFEKEIPMPAHNVKPIQAFRDSTGNFVVSGIYTDFIDELGAGRAFCKGLFNVKISEKGEILSQNESPLKNAASSSIKIDGKGKINGANDLYIHNAAYTNDGSVFFIGELFSNYSYLVPQDMFVIRASADMKALEPYQFKVPDQKVPQLSFRFFEQSDDASGFSFLYKTVEEKGKKKQENIYIQSTVAGSSSFTQDKIVLDAEADFSKVLPAKFGHVFMIDYFKKAKKLDMRVEKFNH